MTAALSDWFKSRSMHYGSRFQLRRCSSVGANATVVGAARIINEGRISIGTSFRLSSTPVPSNLLAEAGGIIEIGDDVSIGHGSSITAKGRIRIGSGSRLGAFVLAMDTDYHVAGDSAAPAAIVPLEIGRNVTIGNSVTILRGSVIGDAACVRDGAVVRSTVPPGQVVEGVPARPAGASASRPGNVEDRVRLIAQTVFRLPQLPPLDDGPQQIAGWDSLGALSFILALEEEFGVLVDEDALRTIGCLADAAGVIGSASGRS